MSKPLTLAAISTHAVLGMARAELLWPEFFEWKKYAVVKIV